MAKSVAALLKAGEVMKAKYCKRMEKFELQYLESTKAEADRKEKKISKLLETMKRSSWRPSVRKAYTGYCELTDIPLVCEGVFGNPCICNLALFKQYQSITGSDLLELHHRDSNRKNNQPSNLAWLCPTCHAATPDYKGRKRIA